MIKLSKMFFVLFMFVSFDLLKAMEIDRYTPTKRENIFENEFIKSWKSTIAPDAPLKLHRHDFSRLVTVLKGGVLESRLENGKILNRKKFVEGESYWLKADSLNQYHYCVNVGNTTIEVVVVEVKNNTGKEKENIIHVYDPLQYEGEYKYFKDRDFKGRILN